MFRFVEVSLIILVFYSRMLKDTAIVDAVLSEVCYAELGCFSNTGPFAWSVIRAMNELPQSPDQVGTSFLLYTRDVIGEHELVVNSNTSLEESDFKAGRGTKVIIHGLQSTSRVPWVRDMKDEFLINGDFNVIAVDWTSGAGVSYTQGAANSRLVGAQVSRLLRWLGTVRGTTTSQYHLIGHSLGAHIAGYAASGTLPGLARITALDAAGPYFDGTPADVRLDPSDAHFVDVIHTDATSTGFMGGLGTQFAVGDVDFYPNSGSNQPGCAGSLMDKALSSLVSLFSGSDDLVNNLFCSHLRSTQYFIESINSPCKFIGYPCSSWSQFTSGNCNSCGQNGSSCSAMGLAAIEHSDALGTKYLATHGSAPYCAYDYDVITTTTPNTGSVNGKLWITMRGENGATSERMDLTKGSMTLEEGSSQRHHVRTRHHLGTVRSIDMSFEDTTWLLNIFYPATWHVDRIELVQHLPQEHRIKFCTHGASIRHQESRTFTDIRDNC